MQYLFLVFILNPPPLERFCHPVLTIVFFRVVPYN